MSDIFSTAVKSEGSQWPPEDGKTDQEGKETSPESSPETNQTETEPSEEGDSEKTEAKPKVDSNTPSEEKQVPFNEHPRWKQIYEENRQLKTRMEELARAQEDVQSKLETQSPEEIPPEFVRLYGNNPEVYKAWRALEDRRISEFQQQTQVEKTAERELNKRSGDYVETSLSELEAEGKIEDRNAFMKFLTDYQKKYGSEDEDGNPIVVLPEDAQGNIDFRKCANLYSEYSSIKSETKNLRATARKEIASDTTSSSTSGEDKPKDFVTADEARRMPWY